MNEIENNKLQIIEILEAWIKYVQERNLEGAVYKHTDDVAIFDVTMPLQSKGLEAYSRTWELFFSNNKGGKESFDLAEIEVVASDDVAFCYGLVNVFNRKVRITIGLKKVNSEWLISHEHHSYPIN